MKNLSFKMINATFLGLNRQDLLKYAKKSNLKERKGKILMILRANSAYFIVESGL